MRPEGGRRKRGGIRSANVEMINRGQLGTLATYGGARRELLLENLFLGPRNYCHHYAGGGTRVLTGHGLSKAERAAATGHNGHSLRVLPPIVHVQRPLLETNYSFEEEAACIF